MNKKKIKVVNQRIVLFWLLLFISTFFVTNNYIDISLYIIGIYFILELLISFLRSKNKKYFIKNNWYEFLLLIPVLKVFKTIRLFKIVKLYKLTKIKKVVKSLETVQQLADISLKISEQYKKK